MTFIFDLPEAEFLPASFELAEKVEAFAAKTGIFSTKEEPKEGEDATTTGKRALRRMYEKAAKEYPTETVELCKAMWLGEGEAPGFYETMNRVNRSNKAADFFLFLLALGR